MKIRIKQHDMTDCGAACIASIASYYNLSLPIARIRQLASTSSKGTSVLGLIEALVKLGFEAKGVRGDINSLYNIPKPAVAHTMPSDGLHHYVVIYGISGQSIEVMDPADGQIHHLHRDAFLKCWTGVMIILLPGQTFQTGNLKVPAWSRFWQLLKPHRYDMIQALIGALAFTLIGLSTSIYVQKIVDFVLIDGNTNLLNLMSVTMISLLLIQTVIGVMKSTMVLHTGQCIDAQLILGYYKHLLRLPQSFFDTMRIGEITSRIGDAVKIRAFINDVSIAMAVNIFVVLLSFTLMFTYYWKLACVMSLIIPCYSLIYYAANRINKKVERKMMETAADLESQLVESLNGIHTVKSFGIESYADHKTETRFVGLLKTVYRSGINSIYTGGASEFIARLFTILLLWAGSIFVIDNLITPGELLSFYALVGYFTGPAASIIGMNKTIQNALIATERLFEIMDLQVDSNENKVLLRPSMVGDIIFKGVDFAYGASVSVFKDFNLTIQSGKITALVGESGSGKSSLLHILQKIHPIQSGSVSIGGYDVKHVEHNSLKKIVSIVPQRIDLFAGNIIDNIALGAYDPDIARIIGICSSLNILDFIEALPQGFYTQVGEDGASLSGGQKQRIAIARALYRDPELLILDEATSSLDSGSEQYVHRVIEIMRAQRKTVIIVAHRLSTVFRADKIIVLNNGRVAEEGNHEDLLRNRQYYFDMWRQQFAAAGRLN